jgi:hypothetical protein
MFLFYGLCRTDGQGRALVTGTARHMCFIIYVNKQGVVDWRHLIGNFRTIAYVMAD